MKCIVAVIVKSNGHPEAPIINTHHIVINTLYTENMTKLFSNNDNIVEQQPNVIHVQLIGCVATDVRIYQNLRTLL